MNHRSYSRFHLLKSSNSIYSFARFCATSTVKRKAHVSKTVLRKGVKSLGISARVILPQVIQI